MKAIQELLNRRWILKKHDPDLYFEIKDQAKVFSEFTKDKLGYALIVNPILIKLEKLPGKAQEWMGIEAFESTLTYVFFCHVLMFMEDREPDEQFILSQITDYIKSQPVEGEPVDWTVYQQRKALIKVLDFCKAEGLIVVSDGDDSGFIGTETAVEVLYENTGASKYFVRRFPFDVTQVNSIKAFEQADWQSEDADRGILRRHRIYRRLLLEPVVYSQGSDDQDFLYIKNQRSVLSHDFEQFIGSDLHIHKNTAMLIFPEGANIAEALPNRKNSSDIVLQCCYEIRQQVSKGILLRQADDRIHLSMVAWDQLLDEVKVKYGTGWTKGYREMPSASLKAEINKLMTQYGMLERDATYKEVSILPAAGKLVGNYPEAYWKNSALQVEEDNFTEEWDKGEQGGKLEAF